jgi:acyl-CoA synthetase (AMP-forming)/AMP-acid ligase II
MLLAPKGLIKLRPFEAMTMVYWVLPEETARTIEEGWLYTEDFGKFYDERYVYIVDRKHDMIISGGSSDRPS